MRNYIGALGTTYMRMGLEFSVFSHHRVRRALKAVDKNLTHVAIPSSIVTPEILRSVIFLLSGSPDFATLRFLILAMFMSLLRQSNFCAQTCRNFDPNRQLTRGDVQIKGHNLYFRIKWEKNHQNRGVNELVLPETSDPLLCPLRAYRRMLLLVPSSRSHDPLIMFKDTNNIPISFVQRVWKQLLQSLGLKSSEIRLHGLRRGGATYLAATSRNARDTLQQAGRWKSNAYMRYIADPRACAIHRAWSRL